MLKKASELSILCGVETYVIIKQKGKLTTLFSSGDDIDSILNEDLLNYCVKFSNTEVILFCRIFNIFQYFLKKNFKRFF